MTSHSAQTSALLQPHALVKFGEKFGHHEAVPTSHKAHAEMLTCVNRPQPDTEQDSGIHKQPCYVD